MKTKYCSKCGSKNIEINNIRTDPIKDTLSNVNQKMFLGSTQPIYRCKDCGFESSIFAEKENNKDRKK